MANYESSVTEEPKAVEKPDYSKAEEEYLAALKKRLSFAKEQRDQAWDEFDGMSYLQYYEANERAANTFIAPKKNREDTNFQSGVVRQKLFGFLAALTNLNLSGDISAYDKDSLKIQSLGDAMEVIIAKTNELDNDDEKRFLRFYELLKHGTVFVEEVWLEQEKKVKRVKKAFEGKLAGAKWEEKLEQAFAHPTRTIIPGTNVYLGDMTKYDIADQPFIFTVDQKPYDEAEALFCKWDRWKFVSKKLAQVAPEEDNWMNWRLLEAQDNQVEIVRYQDKWNNELAVLCNGVLMTPVGLPLPFGFDDYTIVQQNLEPIHHKFAYGKSLVARIKNKVALLDEFMRLGILKTQKSFMPPYLNLSGRMITARALMPGKISYGIPRDSLVPINDKESEGMSNAELAMIREVEASINAETVSPTFTGQQTKGDPTATEIVELQRQAKMVLGLTIFAASTLEWKLTWKRLKNVLNNWFRQESELEGEDLVERYKNTGVDKFIEGEGQGRKIVIPTKKIPDELSIMRAEDMLSMEQGMPVRLIFLDPEGLNLTKLLWQVNVVPKEKKSSEVEKLLFRAEMQDAQMFGPLLNVDYLAERFANVWGENPQKMFKRSDELQQPGMEGQPQPGNGSMTPDQMLPTAEKALSREVKANMGMNA